MTKAMFARPARISMIVLMHSNFFEGFFFFPIGCSPPFPVIILYTYVRRLSIDFLKIFKNILRVSTDRCWPFLFERKDERIC